MMTKNHPRGFIALISSVMISLVLVGLIFTTNEIDFLSRFSRMESEYKLKSQNLAESCIDVSKFKINQNLDYTGDEIVMVGEESCKIEPITYEKTNDYEKLATIITVASFHNSYTKLRSTIKIIYQNNQKQIEVNTLEEIR